MIRVLVTGSGGPGAVNLARSLRLDPEMYTVGCDASPYYLHLSATHVHTLVPRCSEREAYIAAIVALCHEHAIDVVVPSNSLEAHVLSAERDRIPARLRLPPTPTLDLANSKWRSYEIWRDAGLPVPRTWLLHTAEDVEHVFSELRTRPVWVRGAGIPGKGIGGAALPCRTVEHALAWIDFYHGYGGMIASEFLPGENLTWIGLFDRGQLVTSAARERLAYVIPHVSPSGITGAPAITRTVHRPDLNTLAVRAALALDHRLDGVSFLDFKADAEGRPRLTELNAGRFGTTVHFYSCAGLNLPALLVRLALQQPLGPVSLTDAIPAGLTWIRTLDAGPVLLGPDGVPRALPVG